MVVYMVKTPEWPADRFRALLDRILDETGMSQAQLAALVPMDQSQISRWKGGKSQPKFASLSSLGEALRKRYPDLGIGPAELTASAGYSPDGDPASDVAPEQDTPVPVTGVAELQAFLQALRKEVAIARAEAAERDEAARQEIARLRDEVVALREGRDEHQNGA